MTMINRIAFQNMKYYKNKNLLTGVAIMLTTLLLYLVPTIGYDMVIAQNAMVNAIFPSWHAMFRDMDAQTVEKLAAYHDTGKHGVLAYAGYMKLEGAEVSLAYLDEGGFGLYNMSLTEGRLPAAENEIVVSEGVLKELGQTGGIGDTITVPYQIFRNGELDYAQEKVFEITGMLKSASDDAGSRRYAALVSEDFLLKETVPSEIRYRFLFQVAGLENAVKSDVEGKIKDMAEIFSVSENDIRVNDEYLFANYVDPSMLPIIMLIMAVIVAAGVITIYSINYVGMPQRIREYGKLRAIGATKRQLRQIVLREGYATALFAIPAGLLIGSLCVKSLFIGFLPKLHNTYAEAMQQVIKDGSVRLYYGWTYILSVLVTIAAIHISLLKPMRIAGAVSEMEAISYHASSASRKPRKSKTSLSASRLAGIYLMGNKKASLVTVCSMAATGIFIMVVATVLSCANPKESANGSILGQYEILIDIEIGNKEKPENEWSSIIQNNPLDETLRSQIEMVDGVQQVVCFSNILITSPLFGEGNYEGLYGVPEEYADELIDGILEGSVTYEELKAGDKVIVDRNLLYWYPGIAVGDFIELYPMDNTGRTHTVQVAAIGDYTIGFTGYNYLMMADEGARALCGQDISYVFHIFAKEAYNPDTKAALGQIIDGNPLLKMGTWQAQYEEYKSVLYIMDLACNAFFVVLGAICIMNMANTMINSVHLRKKEIGMMQAVGMTQGQLTRMLLFEGMAYTVSTLILSVGLGSILGYPAFLWAKYYKVVNISTYHYPVAAAVTVSCVLLALQTFLAVILGRSVRKESVIDRIRFSE